MNTADNSVVVNNFWERFRMPIQRVLDFFMNFFPRARMDIPDGRLLNSISRLIRNIFRRNSRSYSINFQSSSTDSSPIQHDRAIPEYSMNHEKRGLAVIFNQEYFDPRHHLQRRFGTDVDLDSLIKTFERLEFEVMDFTDLRLRDLIKNVKKVASMDHSQADCVVLIILTHGKLNEIYTLDDSYPIELITSFFTEQKCPSLTGKPKLFFVQSCRGEKCDYGYKMYQFDNSLNSSQSNNVNDVIPQRSYSQSLDDEEMVHNPPNHPDFLIVRATMPKYVSFRNTTAGSWFVQELCEALDKWGNQSDMLTLLTHVNNKVANRSSHPDGMKQILCISSMLTKKLIFHAKKSQS